MTRAVFLSMLLLLGATPGVATVAEDPRAIVRAATRAVQGDSSGPMARRWRAAVAGADSTAARSAILGLATIERLTYDYDAAERHYRQLFAADRARADRHDIHAHLGLGLALEAQGQGGDAVDVLYRRALAAARIVGDTTDVGEALLRVGSLALPLAGAGPGLAYVDSALRVLPASAKALRATARCRRAQYFLATGRPGAADTLAASTTSAREAGDPEALGYCLRGATVLHRLVRNDSAGVAAQEELIALRRRIRDRSGLSMALIIRGDQFRALGNFGQAQRFFREALVEARASGNRFIEATVSLGLGGTALMLNDHSRARDHVEQAIASFATANDSASLMLGLSYRPFVSIAAGDFVAAREQNLPMIDFYRKHGDWDHLTDLYRQLATIEMRLGNDATAERALDSAAAAARRVSSRGQLGAVAYDRGQLALRRGQLAAAERGFRQFLTSLDSTERLPRYETRLRLSEVFVRRGDMALAERELRAASDELDVWRATLDDPELRMHAFGASAFEVSSRATSLAVVLAALSGAGHEAAAFDLAERRRARELSERMARASALRDAPAAANSGKRAVAMIGAARTMSVAEIARAIPDDSTAILEFLAGPGEAPTTLFVLTRASAADGRLVAHRLPRADSLVGEIGRLVAFIEGGGNPEPLARSLGATVLGPALAALPPGVNRLVIVADGPMHRMPWDVLRLGDGRHVVEAYSVGLAPSATIAATLWSKPRTSNASEGARVLAFGDPEFPSTGTSDEGSEIFRSALDATGGLPRLPHSAREARLVGGYGAHSDIRLGADASAAALKRSRLADYDVVHLATHALIDDRVAGASVLALGAGDGESGFVTPADLSALDMDAALVVLSACRSAGGVVVDGEGIQGLTAPLLQAGARSVVATAWRISDRATVPFIEAFYDGLASGQPVAGALRAAKLDAIRRGAPPREWAAFSVVGDPFVRVPLVKPSEASRWVLPGVLLAIAVALGAGAVVVARRAALRRAQRISR